MVNSSTATEAFNKLEQRQVGRYLGVPGLFEPGLDNYDNPLREFFKKET